MTIAITITQVYTSLMRNVDLLFIVGIFLKLNRCEGAFDGTRCLNILKATALLGRLQSSNRFFYSYLQLASVAKLTRALHKSYS